jgi:hypothetical protein
MMRPVTTRPATDHDSLAEFLVRAKRSTYAAQGDEASVPALLPGTHQLEFTDGQRLYRDVYAGGRRFAGQEIVYLGDEVEWSMAYAGGVLADLGEADVAEVYAFLRIALERVTVELPFRGPGRLSRQSWRYRNRIRGTIDTFEGRETIARDGVVVHALTYAGGRIH